MTEKQKLYSGHSTSIGDLNEKDIDSFAIDHSQFTIDHSQFIIFAIQIIIK
jgi:hypothetical protein